MTKRQHAAIIGFETLMVMGIGLAALVTWGYFEPQYSCVLGKTPATTAASVIGITVALGSCFVAHRINKAAKAAAISSDVEQSPPATTGLA